MRLERVVTEVAECISSPHSHKRGSLASLGRDYYYPPLKFSQFFFRMSPSRNKDTYCPKGLNENPHDMICHTSQLASIWSEYERDKLCGIAQIA